MKIPYEFSVLRFTYDPLTREFVNVGLVIYSRKTDQLLAHCTQHYQRISSLFERFDGLRLRQTLRFVQDRLNDQGAELSSSIHFSVPGTLNEVLASVLPVDDSSLQFVKGGVGISENLKETADSLFRRYVEKYASVQELSKREDEDIWRSFKAPLERHHLSRYLVPKKIVGKDYEYEFERAWKNGSWHLYQPLSFDLVDGNTIREKANRWVGRAIGLEDSLDAFKLYLLLGEPSDERLQESFKKAENLLHKMPVPHEFVREREADDFVRDLAVKIKEHESDETSPA